MVSFYHIKDITLGPPSHSGHEVYPDGVYTPPDKAKKPVKTVFKKNKYGYPEFSRLEVSFGQIARLFLSPHLTPSHNLVVNEHKQIMGLAVQHLCYVIENKEGLEHPFFKLKKPQSGFDARAYTINQARKIPIYFMNKLPQGFFANLVEAESKGHVTLDYASLASILAASYTLEEDDLHKGNFGFYLVEREGKPHAVFFKIDHDLMFVDSIMGFHTRRPFHLIHGAGAFNISAEDLLSLVSLKDSYNSYWPTKFSYIANPFDNKEYHNYADIDAFSQLANHRDFIEAKWRAFYKHILVSGDLIVKTLEENADKRRPVERAHISLMTQATLARLARLRAVLFSVKEFRDYVAGLSSADHDALMMEIIPPHLLTDTLVNQVKHSISLFNDLCKKQDPTSSGSSAGSSDLMISMDLVDEPPDVARGEQNGFEVGDTPLHTAIKLGEYRYEETLSMFSQFINVPNDSGKTPLDVALERIDSAKDDLADIQKNARFTAKHLLSNGATETEHYNESGRDKEIRAYRFKNPYLEVISLGMRYKDFKRILRDIGEDHRFGLKFKKNLALKCVKHFIELHGERPSFKNTLYQLRDDINGYSHEKDCAGLKYIRQLRSTLWIIRQLRGLYGLTSTLWELNSMINQAIERIPSKEPNCFSFFYCDNKTAAQIGKDLELNNVLPLKCERAQFICD